MIGVAALVVIYLLLKYVPEYMTILSGDLGGSYLKCAFLAIMISTIYITIAPFPDVSTSLYLKHVETLSITSMIISIAQMGS